MLHLLLYYMLVSVAHWITDDITDNFRNKWHGRLRRGHAEDRKL